MMEYAETTALFFRQLIGENIPPPAALKLTLTFISSLVLVTSDEEPVEPWEEEG